MSHVIGLHYWRYGIGGAERVVYTLMRRFVAAGHKVYLLTDTPEEPGDYPVPEGASRIRVPSDLAERPAFWDRTVRELGIDVVVYNSWLSDKAVTDCEAIAASPAALVYATHGVCTYFIDKNDGPRMLGVMRRCGALADVVACLSDVDARFWEGLGSAARVVANPVADYLGPSAPARTAPAGETVVWVGRMDPIEKRPDLAIRAFAVLLGRRPSARLVMVGGGNAETLADTRALADGLGVAGSVEFTGEVSDVADYLRSADVLMITSPTEGFPLSLAEAMHEGLPVVCFAMPNVSLIHGCEGVGQVAWGDCDALAEALDRSLDAAGYGSRSAAVLTRYREVCEADITAQWDEVLACAMEGVVPANRDEVGERLLSCALLGYERLVERDGARLGELESRIAELEAALGRARGERDAASSELGAVTGSASFRAGRALTWLPRRVRDAMRGGRG